MTYFILNSIFCTKWFWASRKSNRHKVYRIYSKQEFSDHFCYRKWNSAFTNRHLKYMFDKISTNSDITEKFVQWQFFYAIENTTYFISSKVIVQVAKFNYFTFFQVNTVIWYVPLKIKKRRVVFNDWSAKSYCCCKSDVLIYNFHLKDWKNISEDLVDKTEVLGQGDSDQWT